VICFGVEHAVGCKTGKESTMPRIPHGAVVNFSTVEVANAFLAADNPEAAAALMAALESDLHNFDFIFPDLWKAIHEIGHGFNLAHAWVIAGVKGAS
jgi:hypothetical protein